MASEYLKNKAKQAAERVTKEYGENAYGGTKWLNSNTSAGKTTSSTSKTTSNGKKINISYGGAKNSTKTSSKISTSDDEETGYSPRLISNTQSRWSSLANNTAAKQYEKDNPYRNYNRERIDKAVTDLSDELDQTVSSEGRAAVQERLNKALSRQQELMSYDELKARQQTYQDAIDYHYANNVDRLDGEEPNEWAKTRISELNQEKALAGNSLVEKSVNETMRTITGETKTAVNKYLQAAEDYVKAYQANPGKGKDKEQFYLTAYEQEAKRALKNAGYDDTAIANLLEQTKRYVNENAWESINKMWALDEDSTIANIAKGIAGTGVGILTSPLRALGFGEALRSKTSKSDYATMDEYSGYFGAQNLANAAYNGVKDKVNWNVGKNDYDVFDMLYDTTTSGLESALSMVTGTALTGNVGAATKISGAMLGASAATSTMQDLTSRGASAGMALTGGIVAGIFESLFENLSIGSFKALQEVPVITWKDWLRNVGKSMLVNFEEEGATELANIIFDTVAMGDYSNYNVMLQTYLEEGKTKDEAVKLIAKDFALQVLEAAAGGGIMGFGFSNVGNAANVYGRRAGIGNVISSAGAQQDLINEGLLSGEGTRSNKLANKYNGRSRLTDYQLGKLVEANEQAIQDEETAKGAAIDAAIDSAIEAEEADEGSIAPLDALSGVNQGAAAQSEQAAETVSGEETNNGFNEWLTQVGSTLGKNGQENLQAGYIGGDVEQYAGEFLTYYAAGYANEDIVDTIDAQEGNVTMNGTQIQLAYEAGVADRMADDAKGGSTSSSEIATASLMDAETSDYTNNTEAVTNGTEQQAGRQAQQQQRLVASEYGQNGAGGQERTDSVDSVGQSAAVAAGTSQTASGRPGSSKTGRSARRSSYESSDGRVSTSADIGMANGTNDSVLVLSDEALRAKDEDTYNVKRTLEGMGVRVTVVSGNLHSVSTQTGEVVASRGAFQTDEDGLPHIFIQADNKNLDGRTIAKHELFHLLCKRSPALKNRVRDSILKDHSTAELRAMVKNYAWLYFSGEEITPELTKYILEEIYADAYAGIDVFKNVGLDYFEGATKFSKGVYENVSDFDEMAPAGETSEDVRKEGRAAGEGRLSYDYSKPFDEQVDDWIAGKIPKRDSLVIGATPDVFKQVGFNALPMTINQNHVDYAINGTKNAEHHIGAMLLKQLPDALKNPVAIIASETEKNTSAVALLPFTHAGNTVVAPVYVDGFGTQNSLRIDSNAVTSIYGRKNAVTSLLTNAINSHNAGKTSVFYLDKLKTTALYRRARVTMPKVSSISDGFVASIRDNGSPVKLKINNVTESQQFKRWFGNSKVVNDDGTPRVVYHGTSGDFNIFDKAKIGKYTERAVYNPQTKKYENVKDEGFFFTTDERLAQEHAEGAAAENGNKSGGRIIEAYLSIKKPLNVEVDEWYARKKFYSAQDWYDYHAREILEDYHKGDYDGIIVKNPVYTDDLLYVVSDSSQVKSAADNIGTFDSSNPGIRYSLEPVEPIQPKSNAWERSSTTDEVRAVHPTLWAVDAESSEERNPTQIKGTVKSYRKIYDALKAEGFDGTILDASSGLGYGTQAGIEEYGFNVEDIEPYPGKSYNPKYTDYSKLNKKYDVIISNAVLNVLPQDQRDALTVKMGQMLNDGGRIFVNVRGTDVRNASSKVAIDDANMEYFISNTGSYQKGFTRNELVAYLRDALGAGYTVETTNKFGAVSAIVTKSTEDGRLSQEADEEYLTAVRSNDMTTAQKMVDERAKQWGAMQNGYDGGYYFYHGTNSDEFTIFDKSEIGSANDDGYFGRGFYFAFTRDEARYYGRNVKKAFLRITNPFDFQKELYTLDGARTSSRQDVPFIINFAEKFPKLAERFTVSYAEKDSDNVREMSYAEFSEIFRKYYNSVDFKVEQLGNEDNEYVVLADKYTETFEDYDGKKHTFTDYRFKQRTYGLDAAKDKIAMTMEYLDKIVYGYLNTNIYGMDNGTTVILGSPEFSDELRKMGYDGVIQSEQGDEAVVFDSEQIKSADPVTYDDDGNVIPLSQRFNSRVQDIRFSMTEPVEEKNNLIALHNLTEDKFLKTLKLGGFAMPSIAITKSDIPHTNFGDITVVFGRETIDPESDPRNTVYSADAWTPTMPQIEYEANPKAEKRIRDIYYPLADKYGYDFMRPMYESVNYLSDTLTRYGGGEGLIKRFADDTDMMNVFLAATGKEPIKAQNKEYVTRIPDSEAEMYDYLIKAIGEDTLAEMQSRGGEHPIDAKRRWISEHEQEILSAWRGFLTDVVGMSEQEAESNTSEMQAKSLTPTFVKVRNYLKNGGETRTTEPDTAGQKKAIREAVDKKEYTAWLHSLYDDAVGNSGVYNNKDLYTASGNRRSFKATHFPATLEGIVNAMASQNNGNTRNVAGFNGIKTLRAGTAERFKSIENMHELEGRLAHLSEAEAEEINDALSERLATQMREIYNLIPHGTYSNEYMELESLGTIYMEAAELKVKSVSNVKRLFGKYGYKLSDKQANDIIGLLYDINTMPVNIFEAKPERAVGFDEIRKVIIPDTASDTLRTELEKAGISNVEEYPAGDNDARMRIANSVPDIRFSREIDENEIERRINNGGREVDNSGNGRYLASENAGEQMEKSSGNVRVVNQNGSQRRNIERASGRNVFREDSEGRRLTDHQGDSLGKTKILDEQGRPLAVYHATDKSFDRFEYGDVGFHFGGLQQAKYRAAVKGITNPITIRAYLNIEQPVKITRDTMGWHAPAAALALWDNNVITWSEYTEIASLDFQDGYSSPAAVKLREILESKGYDGIIYPNGFEGKGNSYIAFHDEQIIRAPLDSSNPDIRYSREVTNPEVLELMKKTNALEKKVEYWKEQAANSREQAKELEKQAAASAKEAESSRQKAEYWEKQTKVSEKPSVDQKSLSKATTAVMAVNCTAYVLGTDADRKEVRQRLEDLYNFIEQGGDEEDELTWTGVWNWAVDIARYISRYSYQLTGEEERVSRARRYLKQHKFYVEPGDAPADFSDWRKRHFGTINVAKGKAPGRISIDSVWGEMQDIFGEGFAPDTESAPLDQLEHVLDELSKLETSYLTSADQAYLTNALANTILDEYYNVKEERTYADRMTRKLNLQKIKNSELKAEEKEKRRQAVKAQKAADEEKLHKALEKQRQKNAENIAEMREKLKKKQQERMQEFKQKLKEMQEERQAKKALKAKIYKRTKELSDMLLKPTDKKHIPQRLQSSVANLLESINKESNYELEFGTDARYHKVEPGTSRYAEPTKRTQAFVLLRDLYKEIGSELVIDPDLLGDKDTKGLLDDCIALRDVRIDDMNVTQLSTVLKAVQAIGATIRTSNKMFNSARWATVHDAAARLQADNANKRMPAELRGFAGRLVTWETLGNLTPDAYMSMLGKTGEELFRVMRDAQDKQTTLIAEAAKFTESLGIKDARKWEQEIHPVTLGGQQVELSTAQIMALYVLSRRDQGTQHIYAGGILPDTIQKKGALRNTNVADPIRGITPIELNDAFSILTIEQRTAANSMQDFLSKQVADWGNEASMAVYGYKKFGEEHYWPIHAQEIAKTVENHNRVASVSNKGFTKAVEPKATNSLKISSIFDDFSGHIQEMATYAAWLETSEDLRRIRNYIFRDEEGNRLGTIEGTLKRVHGSRGAAYWDQLQSDIALGTDPDRVGAGLTGGLTGRFKAAAVGGNIRVIIQQPTAIFRALDMISPAYLMRPSNVMKGWEKARKYAPIALWKDWGYFEISTGKRMKDVMFKSETTLDKLQQASMWGAGMADSIAWGQLWNACEAETKAKKKDLKPGTKDYYDVVAKRFTEIVDRTQVVDGILQRSQNMRSRNELNKMASSFMAEPTKQLNMVMLAAYNLKHSAKGTRASALGHMARTATALTISGVINAVAQSIVDAWRDDDRDKDYIERWLESFWGFTGDEESAKDYWESFWDGNVENPLIITNYLPYMQDVVNLLQGYDVERMDMSIISDFISAGTTFVKALKGTNKYTVQGAATDLLATSSKLLGLPLATLERDVKGILNTYATETSNHVLQYHLDKFWYKTEGEGANRTTFMDTLYRAYTSDGGQYRQIWQDMRANGVTLEQARSAMESRMVTDQGVDGATDLAQRWISPDNTEKYAGYVDELNGNGIYRTMSGEDQKSCRDLIYKYLTEIEKRDVGETEDYKVSDATSKALEMQEHGITFAEYAIFKVSTGDLESDKDEEGKTISGSLKEKRADVVEDMDFLTSNQKDYLFSQWYTNLEDLPW